MIFSVKRCAPISVASLLAVSSAFGATAFINQIGYRSNDAKEFTIADASGAVKILDASGQVVLSAAPSEVSYWAPSGQNVQRVDFSELKQPGTYSIQIGGQIVRSDLKIVDDTFEEVLKASLKWYYYQRASMALEETYAGQWKRSAGHTTGSISLHSSTGESGTIQSLKGWYDAGDYGRYIVNSGITTYTLLSLYEHFPNYFGTLKWNIPADGALPDLLAEIKYNLDWMLSMQAADGGVYHKLTSLSFPGDVMPSSDKSALYVIGKGTAASFDFAGVMAAAYRVYKKLDEAFAVQCLEAAKKAYAWGVQNPDAAFHNPSDVSTGEYGDGNFDDEKLFAGTEIFISTGDASYKQNVNEGNVPNWGDVSGLAIYGAATHEAEMGNTALSARQVLLEKSDAFVDRANSGFGVVMDERDFVWGSNAVAANQGVWLLYAYYLTGEKKYYDAARKVLDYLLGKNPLNLSFLTGFGTVSPKYPHHRPSTADKIAAPVPGMLVGGPQPGGEDIGSESWECSDYRTGFPATSYVDNRCSYASNEVAINWNAPFAYLAGAIEALNSGHKPDFAEGSTALKPVLANSKVNKQSVRLYFNGEKVFVEKNGKRFDLKGMRIP
ncbi:glycoside hydrolase family 9 protein [uncultured Fibrobacter sp.]|uniref:glycoside hydrolase family 9 protein n=1 Tax=uncultured Fibrobacter sp. TaxID=261512 RepID=UPI00259A03D7|nr:glycoside hydrolase family 9 protein [uncultured Fibrobacter sp.]